MITGDPILPPELERDIFELVVSIDTDFTTDYRSHQHVGDTVLVLPRVCRRVQSWIEPLIYERVTLLLNSRLGGRDPFTALLSTVDARPATFFAAHVKHLYLDRTVPLSTVTRILSVCTGVVSFGCHHPSSDVAPVLSSLPLRRLLVAELSFSDLSTLPPWGSSLTHLGLSSVIPTSASTILAQLPSLTHLAVDSSKLPYGVKLGPVVTALLAAVPHVRFLVLLTGSRPHHSWVLHLLRAYGLVDPRVHVHRPPRGGDTPWHAWSWRVPDCFAVAESQLRQRQGTARKA
ncbi:hypothetical protein FB45DRAFT_931252 [Roridomyces roridus]|uniref:Uncharacterized protein n=1 Tax=Roridomyces roridus TaxID=1738132 RepID=A0AAD7BFX1_9AGAR|nr:hypothetical protein FB45DRAFT_931252 [Roridomyces roridus]